METFPWWTDEHKKLEKRIGDFVEEVMPLDAETRWTREFPRHVFNRMMEEGFSAVGVPKEYGGLGLGATGACIASEGLNRMPGPGRLFVGNMLGGLRQIIEFGNEDLKRRYLPQIAKGGMGAIVITEPFAGTDVAAIESTAKREGDVYILNGKKRFIVNAGVAKRYVIYARTSDDPEDIRKHRHLTGFMVEKGMPGFSIEKINEIMGFENIQNGALDFDKVPVPAANVIGKEGQGWKVMTAGLNFERTCIAAQVLGWQRELIRYVVPFTERRVQFGSRTSDFVNNQLKISEMIMRLKMARLMLYYTAYLWDLGWDITVESNIAKVCSCEGCQQSSLDAIQVMGGDGVTPFYPLSAIMNVAKVENIAGGTMDACKLVIYRSGTRLMADDLKMPRRVIHEKLGVPVPASGKPGKKKDVDEEGLLRVLAEDYRVNPGLHMSRDDIKELFDVDENQLDEVLTSLEQKKLVKLYRGKKGIELAKATYDGLRKANPLEYYQWFPAWVKKENIF